MIYDKVVLIGNFSFFFINVSKISHKKLKIKIYSNNIYSILILFYLWSEYKQRCLCILTYLIMLLC